MALGVLGDGAERGVGMCRWDKTEDANCDITDTHDRLTFVLICSAQTYLYISYVGIKIILLKPGPERSGVDDTFSSLLQEWMGGGRFEVIGLQMNTSSQSRRYEGEGERERQTYVFVKEVFCKLLGWHFDTWL